MREGRLLHALSRDDIQQENPQKEKIICTYKSTDKERQTIITYTQKEADRELDF